MATSTSIITIQPDEDQRENLPIILSCRERDPGDFPAVFPGGRDVVSVPGHLESFAIDPWAMKLQVLRSHRVIVSKGSGPGGFRVLRGQERQRLTLVWFYLVGQASH